MKRFGIMITAVGTERNKTHKGSIRYMVVGKQGEKLDITKTPIFAEQEAINACIPWRIDELGYKSMNGAMKGLKAMQEKCDFNPNHRLWDATCKIIELP